MLLVHLLPALIGCGGDFSDPSRRTDPAPAADAPRHSDVVLAPTTLGVVDTPVTDIHGTPVGVACATCHAPDGAIIGDSGVETDFHTGVKLVHGTLTCAHCHDPVDRARLRLADATTIAILDVVTLCSQCHGTQARDHAHGAHGGMNGYWDTRRGPRERTVCVTCHAPHSPAYEAVMPAPSTRDRFRPDSEGAH